MPRIDHWEIPYEQHIDEKYDAPFKWGEHDCATFAANCIQAITGVDVYEEYRGKYTDKDSAFELIKSVTGGGTTVEDTMSHAMLTHEFITELSSPLYACRGDVVSLVVGDDITLGVVGLRGTHFYVTGGINNPEHSTLLEFPISKASKAWAIL